MEVTFALTTGSTWCPAATCNSASARTCPHPHQTHARTQRQNGTHSLKQHRANRGGQPPQRHITLPRRLAPQETYSTFVSQQPVGFLLTALWVLLLTTVCTIRCKNTYTHARCYYPLPQPGSLLFPAAPVTPSPRGQDTRLHSDC